MVPSSSTVAGSRVAISRSVASWKTTYAGTPCSFAVSARQARSARKTGSAAAGRSTGTRAPLPERDPDSLRDGPAGAFSFRIGTLRRPPSTSPLSSVSTSVP